MQLRGAARRRDGGRHYSSPIASSLTKTCTPQPFPLLARSIELLQPLLPSALRTARQPSDTSFLSSAFSPSLRVSTESIDLSQRSPIDDMAPSLTNHASFVRPWTSDRPSTRDQSDNGLVIPSRTSSLHSRITQPIPSTLNMKTTQRTPKTLTHAYMVCGVGREPSQWVKAPPPAQGKIQHMKGAVGQFWLPEILGSSPRLEQDNEIARSLHAAMRVRTYSDMTISAVSEAGNFSCKSELTLPR